MNRFETKSVLISAGADGLGLAMAKRFANEGGRVAIADNSPKAIASASRDKSLETALFIQADLLNPEEVDHLFKELEQHHFSCDILINNAGGSLHTPADFLKESDEDWQRVLELNVMASVRLLRACIPIMKSGGYGRIINMGSKAGRYGSVFTGANYVAAKGAIQSMTLQLAQELGPYGITCNAVCPGAIMTDRVKQLLAERQTPAQREAVIHSIPLRRHGQPEEVAALVAFLASDEAGFITGQLIDINGGQGMSS